MPLDLRRPRVEHGGGEDGEDGGLGVEDALLKDGVVLLHPGKKKNEWIDIF